MLKGDTVSTFKRVCVLLSMLGGGTATISILNQECVLMSIFGGGATISIFNCVCVLVSMLGGDTAIQQQPPSSTVYVCSCPCLFPPWNMCSRWHSHNLHLDPWVSVCAYINDRWHSHNLYLEPWVCVLMSCLEWHSHNLHFETCVCVCVCSCQCLVGRNGRTFLAKERQISIIIQMSSEST